MYTQKAAVSKQEWSTVGVQVRAEVTAAERTAKQVFVYSHYCSVCVCSVLGRDLLATTGSLFDTKNLL